MLCCVRRNLFKRTKTLCFACGHIKLHKRSALRHRNKRHNITQGGGGGGCSTEKQKQNQPNRCIDVGWFGQIFSRLCGASLCSATISHGTCTNISARAVFGELYCTHSALIVAMRCTEYIVSPQIRAVASLKWISFQSWKIPPRDIRRMSTNVRSAFSAWTRTRHRNIILMLEGVKSKTFVCYDKKKTLRLSAVHT